MAKKKAKKKENTRLDKYTWTGDDIIIIRRRGIKSSDITGKKPKKPE